MKILKSILVLRDSKGNRKIHLKGDKVTEELEKTLKKAGLEKKIEEVKSSK